MWDSKTTEILTNAENVLANKLNLIEIHDDVFLKSSLFSWEERLENVSQYSLLPPLRFFCIIYSALRLFIEKTQS